MKDDMELENLFTYHAPVGDQPMRYAVLREAALTFAKVIVANTPECADQTAAIRKLRECVMTANASIACWKKPEMSQGWRVEAVDGLLRARSRFIADRVIELCSRGASPMDLVIISEPLPGVFGERVTVVPKGTSISDESVVWLNCYYGDALGRGNG